VVRLRCGANLIRERTLAVTTLRISATGRGLNYLPEYVAQQFGLFAARGLDVTSWACDPWTGVLDDLQSGKADIVLGGLWVPAMYAHTPRRFVAMAQVNARFAKTVLTREPVESFQWSDLAGKVVLVPGAGGTAPYEFPAGLMREAGYNPAKSRFMRDLSGSMMTELFRAGTGDVYMTDLVTAASLAAEGVGHMVLQMAYTGGVMPNSVYYVRPDQVEATREVMVPFTDALEEAARMLAGGLDDDALLPIYTEFWPKTDPAVLATARAIMQDSGLWETTVIDPAAAGRWLRMLQEAGLASPATVVEDFVDLGAGA
jgi:NitT/TauT family transport system substrate-binding protein